jgi:hypothetical protein
MYLVRRSYGMVYTIYIDVSPWLFQRLTAWARVTGTLYVSVSQAVRLYVTHFILNIHEILGLAGNTGLVSLGSLVRTPTCAIGFWIFVLCILVCILTSIGTYIGNMPQYVFGTYYNIYTYWYVLCKLVFPVIRTTMYTIFNMYNYVPIHTQNYMYQYVQNM